MNIETFIKKHPDSAFTKSMIFGNIGIPSTTTTINYYPGPKTKPYSSAVSRLKLLKCDTVVNIADPPICMLCKNTSVNIKLNCEHVFCFNCAKNYSIRMQCLKCPDCNIKITYLIQKSEIK